MNIYLFIKKPENVNMKEFTSEARNMDLLKVYPKGHEKSGQSLSFARCSLDLN